MAATRWMPFIAMACALALASAAAAADMELTAPDGRRVLLKDDGTWRYADDSAAKPAGDATSAGKKPEGEAVLSLEGKIEGNRICRLQLRLVNNLPYEIRSLVPELSISRPNGVVYDSLLAGFSFLKPGDNQRREVRFNGIDCKDIARVLVGGGDRCEMGDLDKFTPGRGMCLARVRVVASDVLPFEKKPAEAEKPDAKGATTPAKPEGADAKGAGPASDGGKAGEPKPGR
jgi:hypothetical protein